MFDRVMHFISREERKVFREERQEELLEHPFCVHCYSSFLCVKKLKNQVSKTQKLQYQASHLWALL